MIIYEGTLDRFGYELKVFADTAEECEERLMAEYVKTYKHSNGSDPREDIAEDRHSDLTYYELAREDICIGEYELGTVTWC